MTLSARVVDLRSWVRETVDVVRWRTASKRLALALDIAISAALDVEIDLVRVRQIALNLLVNAINCRASGVVMLRVSLFAARRGRTGTLLLEVRDTGIGNAPDRFTHLFYTYWQENRASCPDAGAVGSASRPAENLSVSSPARAGTRYGSLHIRRSTWCCSIATSRTSTATHPRGRFARTNLQGKRGMFQLSRSRQSLAMRATSVLQRRDGRCVGQVAAARNLEADDLDVVPDLFRFCAGGVGERIAQPMRPCCRASVRRYPA